jgi:hypothetical protein
MIMNDKKRQRKAIYEMIKYKRIDIRQAAEQCDICYDQMHGYIPNQLQNAKFSASGNCH